MTTSHADNHDRDKLGRWYRDLSSGTASRFPIYAMFLVSQLDRASHGIFRQFRSSFEARNAGFEHLVIFGQHGISSTVRGLLTEFGWDIGAIPVLVLCGGPVGGVPTGRDAPTMVYSLPLPAGSETSPPPAQPWLTVLARVEAAVDEGKEGLELASVPELTAHQLGERPLVELVGRLLESFTP